MLLNRFKNWIWLSVLSFIGCLTLIQPLQAQRTFTNPIKNSGPDPWVLQKDGWYYYMNTTGQNLTLWKTRNIADLATAESKVVYTPPTGKPYSRELWAPEIHFLQGRWYIYFSADSLNNLSHRVWVIENESPDPMQGEWTVKGKIGDQGDHWAIDMSVTEYNGQLYAAWSGWEVPGFLQNKNKLFIVYSANACWLDYCLGLLTYTGQGDLLNPKNWTKSAEPVFQQSPENDVWAPGHGGFFRSPDGKQDWMIYHANPTEKDGCGNKRAPHIQPFTWNKDGSPNFGVPFAKKPMAVPSEK